MNNLELPRWAFLLMGALLLLAISTAAWFNQPLILTLPFGVFALFLAGFDFRMLYFLMWACIPLSTELYFSNGLGTDFPSEPLMLLLTGSALLFVLSKLNTLSFRLLLHPITLLLILHFGWMCLAGLHSEDPLISAKFVVSKSWYLVVFYGLGYVFVRDATSLRKWMTWVLLPLLFTIVVIIVRHGLEGFSFISINQVVAPFYRNHVNFACILAVFFPFAFMGYWLFPKGSPYRRYWPVVIVLLLFAIYISYARVAYVSLVIAAATYVIMRFRLVKTAILTAGIAASLFVTIIAYDNRYIDFAPDYERTITHHQFDHLLEATYKFEDISTMERFYRWIAGFYMIREKPLLGFGPGTFYHAYTPYTDQNFVTYVSDNPEQSGVHNYYIMTMTDQGIPGLVIFLALLIVALLISEKLFHRFDRQGDYFRRNIVIASSMSLYVILFILLLNDMLETDKVGSFFLLILALLARLDLGFNGGNDNRQMMT